MDKIVIELWQMYLGFIVLLASVILNIYQFMIIKPIKENYAEIKSNYKEIQNTMKLMSERIAKLESRTSSTETAICYLRPESKVN